ncbi:MAG: polysaccharide export protein [Butyrivibrio sp.]|nr:polysaccharide export protein [Butyrivibrio sp.]
MSDEILNSYNEEDEIDFGELFFVLMRKWWLLISCAIAGAGIALAYTLFLIQPVYTSSSMIYIFSKTTTVTSAIDLQIGKQLTVDFEILGKSRPVLEKVISDLELDTTYESLLKTVTVENPTDSRIIKITVKNTDPQLASDIANNLADNLSARVAEVIDTDKPSSVENAVPATKPSSPSKSKNTALGGILGFLLAAAIILILYYSDMSLRDEDDVRKYLGLGTLASIPFEKSISADHESKKTKKNKKRKK